MSLRSVLTPILILSLTHALDHPTTAFAQDNKQDEQKNKPAPPPVPPAPGLTRLNPPQPPASGLTRLNSTPQSMLKIAYIKGVLSDSETALPVGGADVVFRKKGKVIVKTTTDENGRYQVKVEPGFYEVVFKFGGSSLFRVFRARGAKVARVNGRLRQADGEVIVIRERRRVRKAAATNFNALKTPPYSDRAIKSNRWARAWLVLDVNPEGLVTRAKFMHKPGEELEKIALDQVFKLEFDPSINEDGVPIRTLVLWSIDWPSYWWLIDHYGTAAGMPRRQNPTFSTAGLRKAATSEAALQGPGTTIGGLRIQNLDPEAGQGGSNRSPFGTGFRTLSGAEPIVTTTGTLADSVPCRGQAPKSLDAVSSVLRDCTPPDFNKLWNSEPWHYPQKKSAVE